MTAVLAGLAVGFATFALAKLALVRRERRQLRRRIVVNDRVAAASVDVGEGQRFVVNLERLFGATEQRLGPTRGWKALEQHIARAGIARQPVAVFWTVLGAGITAGLLLAAVTGAVLLLFVVPALVLVAAWAFLSLRASRRLRTFDEQLPALLSELAASLRAGHSLSHALESITEDAEEPARSELQQVIAETRLGRPLEDALAQMNVRLPSAELRYVLSAIAVQRQVGGSMASLFDLVAATVQERQRFERKVRSLTASGRMSAYVLIAMPIGLAAVLSAIKPGYLSPLFRDPTGRLLVFFACILMIFGAAVLKKLVSIKGVST